MTAIISLLMITKMLYQIQYINHDKWNVNCTVSLNKYHHESIFLFIFR